MATEATITRRYVLRRGATAGAALAAGSICRTGSAAASPFRANDHIRLGVIGTGVRGKYLIANLPESARVVAICDCAKWRMEETLKPQGHFTKILASFRDSQAADCATYQDYRQMIDRQQLDAVVIATPDHHHALAALWALEAGLDVYLEKPMTLTIHEGRLIADKVRNTGRILQVGSQQRSMERNRFACEFVRDGGLGKVLKVSLPNYPGPIVEARYPKQPTPDGLDWDLFLGPAPMRVYDRRLWVKDEFKVGALPWRGWDLFRDFSGHLMTNWGAHSIDMMQYALGCDNTGPISIRVGRPNTFESIPEWWGHKTPDPASPDERRFWPVEMEYANGTVVVFEGGNGVVRFQGELGTMKIRRNFFEVDPPELVKGEPDANLAAKWKGDGHVARPHLENWLDCIRSRKQPVAPAEVGHRTATVCHLANIAREVNRPLQWSPKVERFVDDEVANQKLDRPRRRGFELPG